MRGRRRATRIAAAAAIALGAIWAGAPAGALARTCPDDVTITKSRGGKVYEAEYLEMFGRVVRKKAGALVEGSKLEVLEQYYTDSRTTINFKDTGVTYTVRPGTYFMPACYSYNRWPTHVRVFSGRATAAGPRTTSPDASISTPEAHAYTYPGAPHFNVTRIATTSRSRTRTVVSAAPRSASLFVKFAGAGGRNVPCRSGDLVTFWADGRYS